MAMRKHTGMSAEGVLIFNHKLQPLYCNEEIQDICGRVCKLGKCAMERPEHEIPEFFRIVRKLKEDYQKLSSGQKKVQDPRPTSVIYLSESGSFKIRCLIIHGGSLLSKGPLWQVILEEVISLHDDDIDIIDKKYGFTRREKDVLSKFIRGFGPPHITKDLGISKETLKIHLRHIFQKMGITRRSELLSRLG